MVIAQRDVLSAYLALNATHSDWRSKLLLIEKFGPSQAALAMAGLIAGAAVLSLCSEAADARQATQTGCCDFAVNTLNEALRILKLEVRKGRPVGVVLVCNPTAVELEMSERGVVPDFCMAALVSSAASEFLVDHAETYAERTARDREMHVTASATQKRWLLSAPTYFPRDLDRWYSR